MMALRCYGSPKKHRLEGIVSKKREAPYRSGPCRDWRKIKTADWKAATGSGGTVRAALASPLSCVTPIPLGHLDLDDVIDKAVASKSVCQARRSPRPGGRLAMMKRLSTTVRSLNRLAEDPVEADPAKRARGHRGFAEA
jgi:hypothetical protein